MKPLKDMLVLDFSKVLAGPLCGQYLGELGADVVKIEPVGSGDDTRSWLPQKKGESATFLAVNHNKRSLAVDLKTDAGRAIVHRLTERADIVLQGFGGSTASRLGVDHQTLSDLNPSLVYCEISGYGREGPLGSEPGYDVMLQAFSGMVSTMGQPGGPLARASFSPVDLGTGMLALSAVLAAVIERSRSGAGQYVDVSLLDTSMGFLSYMAQSYWLSGTVPGPMGTAHPSMCPYQSFEARNGTIMIGVGNDAQWRRFCIAADIAEKAQDPDFARNADRVERFAETVALVQRIVVERDVEDWMERLRKANVPCSPIHTLDQALDHPQVAARELVTTSEHPVLGPTRAVGLPIRFARAPRATSRPAPLLGQHTAEILAGVGYSSDEIARFMADGVVQSRMETSA